MTQKTLDPQTLKFAAAVIEALPREISGDIMQGWIQNPKGLKRVLAKGLCPPSEMKLVGDVYDIIIDYSLTLPEMIAAGNYGWKNDDINKENFQIKGEGKLELKPQLIHFNRAISSDEAEAELDPKLRMANLEEVLAFGAKYPDLQKRFPIIALKAEAAIRGRRRVVSLGRDGSRRRLYLYWRSNDWSAHCRFPAVPKVSGA